jgi:radical SAM protein with 4Fe4S-binding SPASM domain
MLCPVSQRRFAELSAKLERATTERRIPYMGAFELTYRCNLNCQHCFCNLPVGDEKKKQELSFNEIRRILDEMVQAGCLWLLITGGESLIREDFLDIYDYALSRGVFLEIFTNATLITDKIAKRFAEKPPLGIEISIYGAAPEVHDQVTRVPGSYDTAMLGIKALKKHGVPFSLKTIVLTTNVADLNNMQKLANDLGVEFKFDSLVCGRKDGGASPLAYRVPVSDIVGFEFLDKDSLSTLDELFSSFWKKELKDMLICSAGINSFNVDPYGFLSPCTMYKSFQYSLRWMLFGQAWEKLVQEYGTGPNDFLSDKCKKCSMVSLCPNCPAWSELEIGRLDQPVDYLCQYGLKFEERYLKEQVPAR